MCAMPDDKELAYQIIQEQQRQERSALRQAAHVNELVDRVCTAAHDARIMQFSLRLSF